MGRVVASERVNVHIASRILENFIEVGSYRGETLFVVWLASQTGNRDVIGPGPRGDRTHNHPSENQSQERAPHTIPHFRRSSHSENRSRRITRKITGIFHSSLVSRTVIPASEYGISLLNFESSSGRQ